MTPLVCSYFTPDYADEAAGLVASLDALGLPHEVDAIPGRGSWLNNCAAKPAFLLSKRAAHPGRSLIWLDADARVCRPLDLFDGPACDFAAHWFKGWELITACLYFAASAPADELLKRWQVVCEARPQDGDQPLLRRVVENDPPEGLRVLRLPPSMNWIDAGGEGPDLSAQFYEYPAGGPVVIQRQASRRLRKKVG